MLIRRFFAKMSSASTSSEKLGVRSDLDDRLAKGRAEHSCLKRLDELMFCMSA